MLFFSYKTGCYISIVYSVAKWGRTSDYELATVWTLFSLSARMPLYLQQTPSCATCLYVREKLDCNIQCVPPCQTPICAVGGAAAELCMPVLSFLSIIFITSPRVTHGFLIDIDENTTVTLSIIIAAFHTLFRHAMLLDRVSKVSNSSPLRSYFGEVTLQDKIIEICRAGSLKVSCGQNQCEILSNCPLSSALL